MANPDPSAGCDPIAAPSLERDGAEGHIPHTSMKSLHGMKTRALTVPTQRMTDPAAEMAKTRIVRQSLGAPRRPVWWLQYVQRAWPLPLL